MKITFRHTALKVVISLALVAAETWFFARAIHVNSTTVALAYLLLVLGIAARWGLIESVVASLAAVLFFNLCFLPPVGTLTIADPQNWVALFAFLITSIVASQLSASIRKRAEEALRRRQEMEQLYELSRALMLSTGDQTMASQLAGLIVRIFDFGGLAFYDHETGQVYRAGIYEVPLSDSRLQDAATQGTDFHDSALHLTILPVRLGGRTIGSLGLLGGSISEAALHAVANLAAIVLERHRAQAVASRAEAARQNEELKSTLLDALAHEFKTPLTSIKAATTAMLSSGAPDHSQQELLTIVAEETDRLNDLVTDALQMARIEAGDVKIEKRPLDLDAAIRSVLVQFRNDLEDRQIEIPTPTMPLVSADPDLLSLVLRQLLGNALKYSPPGSPLKIRTEMAEDTVIVGIADQGPGIPEPERSRIFDRFYRGGAARKRIPGTGMGLSIARDIIEAHGGRIWVESRSGGGAEFRFSVPLATAEAHQ